MNSKRLLCFLLGAALLLQTPATAYAEETLTYEQYKGGSGYSNTTQEQDYAIVEISTEEDLRRLAENCVLDSRNATDFIIADLQCKAYGEWFCGRFFPLCAGRCQST